MSIAAAEALELAATPRRGRDALALLVANKLALLGAFVTLCFVLVGAPLAILLKKADVMTTFGFLFVPILIAYYPLLMGCCDRAKAGGMPPYVIWIPNLLLAVVGVWLMKRVIRY